MLPLAKILWFEATARERPARQPEPCEAMVDPAQVDGYAESYRWGGPGTALLLLHLHHLSRRLRPGDVVVDLACGPGPLILELAPLYPGVRFIGADLSPTMLDRLRRRAQERGLANVEVLEEDIRTLPSLGERAADWVICTAALHHVPTEADLDAVFQRVRTLLKPGGGFYFFDFGLLRSEQARALFVADMARKAPPVTTQDYAVSLAAAFPVERVGLLAERWLPRPFELRKSLGLDFYYFLMSPPRTAPDAVLKRAIAERSHYLTPAMWAEYVMLRFLNRRFRYR